MMAALLQGIMVAGVLQGQATYTHDLASHSRPLDPQLPMGKPSLATPGQPTVSPEREPLEGTATVRPSVAK